MKKIIACLTLSVLLAGGVAVFAAAEKKCSAEQAKTECTKAAQAECTKQAKADCALKAKGNGPAEAKAECGSKKAGAQANASCSAAKAKSGCGEKSNRRTRTALLTPRATR